MSVISLESVRSARANARREPLESTIKERIILIEEELKTLEKRRKILKNLARFQRYVYRKETGKRFEE